MGDDLKHRKAVEVAEAIYDYSPQNDGDLELHKGDTVEVLEKPSKDWWKGSVNGKTGAFPSNYVQLKSNDFKSAEKEGGDDHDHHHTKNAVKRLGNSAIFGVGASAGSNLLNSIF